MNLFRKKTIEMINSDTQKSSHSLKRTLGWFDLILLGLGAIIGTGIFVLTGVAAAEYAGPGLILSFVIAGLAVAFTALSYAEFASSIPVSGSTYSYSYVAIGEIVAWIIGWVLILQYAFSIPTIALGWSGYFVGLLNSLGVHLPEWATSSIFVSSTGLVNLPAMIIILLLTALLYFGTRESATINNIAVIIKISVILFFIFTAIWHVKPVNWTPFFPYGWNGVFSGAAIIFFSFIGFDAVSTAAEETKNPTRNLPIGILGSVGISTILYIVVVAILTGVVSYTQLNTTAPVAMALSLIGLHWASGLISVGAITGITTALLVMIYGSARIFFAIGRDGLLPPVFTKLHPKYKTPHYSTLIVGISSAIMAGFFPIGVLAELVNIGTMFAFIVVSIAVIIMRYTQPDLPRKFKTPFVPLIPLLAIGFTGFLMFSLPLTTWIRFIVWMGIGFIVYFLYGRKHSRLADETEQVVIQQKEIFE